MSLKEKRVVIKAGEHVLIVGAPGTGKTPLFRALAGLWPWGQRARRAARRASRSSICPRGTPYLPRGTLREVLAYPMKVDRFDDRRLSRSRWIASASRACSPVLDETQRWDRELSQDEQLSLALARIVLQQPPWVLLDDTFASLDDEALERIIDVFTHELKTHHRHSHRARGAGAFAAVLARAASRARRRPRSRCTCSAAAKK